MPRQKNQPHKRKACVPVGFEEPQLAHDLYSLQDVSLGITQGFHDCQFNPESLEDWQARYGCYNHSSFPPSSPYQPSHYSTSRDKVAKRDAPFQHIYQTPPKHGDVIRTTGFTPIQNAVVENLDFTQKGKNVKRRSPVKPLMKHRKKSQKLQCYHV
jgi:hypothetical protein